MKWSLDKGKSSLLDGNNETIYRRAHKTKYRIKKKQIRNKSIPVDSVIYTDLELTIHNRNARTRMRSVAPADSIQLRHSRIAGRWYDNRLNTRCKTKWVVCLQYSVQWNKNVRIINILRSTYACGIGKPTNTRSEVSLWLVKLANISNEVRRR